MMKSFLPLACVTYMFFLLAGSYLKSQPVNPSPVPEYEPSKAVVIRYDFNPNTWPLYEHLIRECQEAVHTYLLVNDNTERYNLQNLLSNADIPMHNISLLVIPAHRMWVRDHGPLAVQTDEGTAFMNFLDYNNSDFHDQNLPVSLAHFWSYQHFSFDWILDGGNYMVDNYGTLFATDRLYTNNPEFDSQEIDQVLEEYMGIINIVTISAQHDDYWGHIDMQMKLLNDTTFVISSVEAGSGPNYDILESNVEHIETLTAPNGKPYHIARLPKADNWKTYTNAVILNDKIIIPVYDHPNDEIALNTYAGLMPDHTVVGVNSNAIIGWGGAIHCITRQVFGDGPDFFSFAIQKQGRGEVKVNGEMYSGSMQFMQNQEIDLEAIAGQGFEFERWSGDVSSDENPLSLTITNDLFIETRFERIAKNYVSFYPNDTVAYFDSRENSHRFVRVEDQESFKGGMKMYFSHNLKWSDGDCAITETSFIGEHYLMLNTGEDLFFNQQGDTIRINTLALEGETWMVYQDENIHVEGEVLSHDPDYFMGLTDSVKNIGFSVYDQAGEPVVHPLNLKNIRLSQSYGMVQTLNFLNFPGGSPDELTGIREFPLEGVARVKAGIQNLTWLDVFDFQPGDQLHILESSSKQGNGIENKKIYTFFHRINYPDSVTYHIQRKILQHQTNYSDGTTTDTLIHDTIVSVFQPHDVFDRFALEPVFHNGDNQFSVNTQIRGQWPFAVSKKLNYRWFSGDGDCFTEDSFHGCFMHTYHKGLGGPYYTCDFVEPPGSEKRELVYFKKEEEVWGSPLVITSANILCHKNSTRVFPNPVSGSFYVDLKPGMAPAGITLTDLAGKLVLSHELQAEQQSINVEHLKAGVYLFRILSRKMEKSGKIILQ